MLIIGSHVGFRKDDQLLGSLKEALSYGANTFMFYTGAPQNTKRYPIMDGLTLEAMNLMKENNIDYSMMVLPDHPTPLALRTHTRDAVPYFIYNSTNPIDSKIDCFTESSAKSTGITVEKGHELMKRFIK